MTTVAVNRSCMAADERITDAGPFAHFTKIERIGVSLFGVCGEVHRARVMLEWLRTNRNRQQLYKQFYDESERYSFELVELNPGGIYLWSGWGVPVRLNDKFWASGSGAMAAMAVMKMGHSPEDAVKMACQLDEASGPPVQVEYLKQKRKRNGAA